MHFSSHWSWRTARVQIPAATHLVLGKLAFLSQFSHLQMGTVTVPAYKVVVGVRCGDAR